MKTYPSAGAHGARTFRRSLSLRFALLTAAALLTHSAFAAKPGPNPPPQPPPSSGTLVLDYLYPGGDFTDNWGLTVAPSGTIYASGYANGGGWRGIVLASSNSGSSWSMADNFAPPGRSVYYWDQGGSITSDAAGSLYIVGATFDFVNSIEPDQWYVRRSTDGGASWTTVDEFHSGCNSGCAEDATGLAVDAAGDVYVCGLANNVAGNQTWTIRKGVTGTSFSTVDALPHSYPMAIFAHPTAGLFAVGRKTVVINNKASGVCLVRRSTDGGVTWSDSDTFQISSGNGARASGIGTDEDGNLYVVGYGTTTSRGNHVYHWLVRRSTDNGNSWSTADDFQQGGSYYPYPEGRRFAMTPNGDLYVAGSIRDVQGIAHWIVRKNPRGTGTWATIDDYQYVAGGSAEPHSMAADASGNLFVGGFGWDAPGSSVHWIVKKY